MLTRALLQVAQAGHARPDAPTVFPRLDAAAVDTLLPAAAPAAGSVLQQGASDLVRRAFERCGSVSETARCLGISRTTVYRHLRAG